MRILNLATTKGAKVAFDRLHHRALEVEASSHLAGKLDRLPHQEAHRAAGTQVRVAAGHEIVGTLTIPDQIESGMGCPVDPLGEEYSSRAVRPAGCV